MGKRSLNSEQHMHGTTAKKKRSGLQLSNMPTDILCSIMSKLPLKEAVRTSILSQQWKYHWCCHSNLEFSFTSMLSSHHLGGPITADSRNLMKQEFIERVDAVLKQHSGLGVENFRVWVPFNNGNTDPIERWVNFAVASKTKHLTFNFSSARCVGKPCIFDLRLLDGSVSLHLQYVELSSVFLQLPVGFKGFQNLRRLHLADTTITDEDLHLLMSNCNVLEFLRITDCSMLTRIHISHPSNPLKHLQVHKCRSLQVMELNFGLITLEYSGPSIPLSPPGTLLLTKISMKPWDSCTALEYIFTELPSTVPRLEMLTLKCHEVERATLPEKLPKFVYLRHLRLELSSGPLGKKVDALDFACLLVAAPFLEKLEFHMWRMVSVNQSYGYGQQLRSIPSQPHCHLRFVGITGFYGQKDQLELALHILRNAAMLEAMKIDPKPSIAAEYGQMEGLFFLDGYQVARDYVLREDKCNVVYIKHVPRKTIEAKFLSGSFWSKLVSEQKAKWASN